jgi:hypothetical protein
VGAVLLLIMLWAVSPPVVYGGGGFDTPQQAIMEQEKGLSSEVVAAIVTGSLGLVGVALAIWANRRKD